MASADDEYLIKRNKQFERRVRIMTMVSLVSFLGSILFGGAKMVQQAINHPQVITHTPVETSLQDQVQSYELVLKREPNNQLALEKLSVLRLRLKDFKGSIEILEKLVQLHPDRQDYKALLEQMKKQQGQQKPN